MKKLLFPCLIGVVLGVFPAGAQDMKSLFVNMPDSVAPLLTKVNREDCVDFLDSDMKAEVKNRFGNTSELETLTADYFRLRLTSRSTLEMKLLEVDDSVHVVCAVHTVCGPACDSRVCFYDTRWKELSPGDYFRMPPVEAFFRPDTAEMAGGSRGVDMYLVRAVLSPDDPTLTLTCTTPDYLSADEREALLARFRPGASLLYVWEEGRFRLQEEAAAR